MVTKKNQPKHSYSSSPDMKHSRITAAEDNQVMPVFWQTQLCAGYLQVSKIDVFNCTSNI